MKYFRYVFVLILFCFCLYDVNAETIKTINSKKDNISWIDNDNSNSINNGDDISIEYKNGITEYNANQQFNVLKVDGEYTYLFAKYNLNIGTYNVNSSVKKGITAPSIKAWVGNDVINYGTVTLNELNSNLEQWLTDYKNILYEDYGINVETISLLSKSDAIDYLLLSSSIDDTAFKYNSDKYSNTSYWLADMYDTNSRYFINGENNTISKQDDGYSGIRPVIKVKTKDISNININYVKPNNITLIDKDICLNINDTRQCFSYLKKGKNNTAYYFSKYNLNVGLYYNQDKKIGLQDSSIRAWVDTSIPNYGRTSYNSGIGYFKDYKDRIFNSGYNIISIDYLNKSDAIDNYNLTSFNAENYNSITTAFNDNKFSLVYAYTTYWLKDSYKSDYNYYINAENKIGVANDVSGLRPVIELASLDITDSNSFDKGNIEYNDESNTIKVNADYGYALDKLYILNSNGEYLEYSKNSDNTYNINNDINSNINISATFKAINYKFINSNNLIYQENDLEFEVDALDDMIDKLYVDNNLLDSSNYTISNSKIIINKNYLNSLNDNDYTLKVVFKNGTSNKIDFKVNKIYTIKFNYDNNVDFTTPSIKVNKNDSNDLIIKAKLGYKITSIMIDDVECIDKLNDNKLNISNIIKNTNIIIKSSAVSYEFISGMESLFTNKDMVFKLNGPLELFDELYINDSIVGKDNYKLENGSTIIKINKEYLNDFKEGTYTLKVTYKNNTSAITTFNIKTEKESNILNPLTYDNAHKYIIFSSLSLILLVVLIVTAKKNKNRK